MRERPNAQDVMRVGNSMRTVMNGIHSLLEGAPSNTYPLLKIPQEVPTEEQLNEWEQLSPGSKAKLIELAENEMRHRKLRTQPKKRWVFF